MVLFVPFVILWCLNWRFYWIQKYRHFLRSCPITWPCFIYETRKTLIQGQTSYTEKGHTLKHLITRILYEVIFFIRYGFIQTLYNVLYKEETINYYVCSCNSRDSSGCHFFTNRIKCWSQLITFLFIFNFYSLRRTTFIPLSMKRGEKIKNFL